MIIEVFRVEGNKIALNKHKLTVRFYTDVEKTSYEDRELYLNDEELTEWKTQLIPKHQLYELVSEEELDTPEYAWMEGIEINPETDRVKQIEQIASYGSLEAYQASLQETRDEYLLDLEYRISAMELGLNE